MKLQEAKIDLNELKRKLRDALNSESKESLLEFMDEVRQREESAEH